MITRSQTPIARAASGSMYGDMSANDMSKLKEAFEEEKKRMQNEMQYRKEFL